ncbi:hypothetical protein IPJ70_01675 [Candidatus Campbellbacteria bacterium]|nr:MAG: hypothetical protein IPJ70_01675 [Candidatus Campbellbacteria bacterium]
MQEIFLRTFDVQIFVQCIVSIIGVGIGCLVGLYLTHRPCRIRQKGANNIVNGSVLQNPKVRVHAEYAETPVQQSVRKEVCGTHVVSPVGRKDPRSPQRKVKKIIVR